MLSPDDYFFVPEYSLAEAVNGKLFRDDGGMFGSIRERISDVPRDVLLKKIAGNLFEMHQSGVYNFKRCISHGEAGASVLAINRFVTSTVAVIFNINRKFSPYYKWQFRALRELSVLGDLSDVLEYIVTLGSTEKDVELKSSVVDSVSDVIVNKLRDEGFCDAVGGGLIDAAYSVNKKITDPVIRNRSIMYAVH
ncbi:MAG: DUF4037 domain-containing protein [Firmicutes bacterium]|nr:DUF4037 domain-containing protein [Candidatus Colimorpha enterica]